MTGTTHTLPESSTEFDVDALLAGLLERHTSTPAAATSATAEVDELLTRALDEIGLTSLIQPRAPVLPPQVYDPPEPTERAAPTIVLEPIPLPQRPPLLTETPWLDGSPGRRTLLELSPNDSGVYAPRLSALRRRARPLRRTLERLADNVVGIWVAAIAVVTATVILWTMEAPVRVPARAQRSTPGTAPPALASRPRQTDGIGSAPVASARPREPIAKSAEPPRVAASLASRGPIERAALDRSNRTAAVRAQNAAAPAAPTREIATEPTAPALAEAPTSLPQFDTRAVTEVAAQPTVPSEPTPPATTDATERAIPTNEPTSAPPPIDVAAATPEAASESGSSVSRRSQPPTILARVQPVYPTLARSAGIHGTVRVEFSVDDQGRVVRTNATTGPVPLRAAAEAAVKQWRFTPALMNGVPQPGSGSVTVVFRLR